MDPRWLFPLLAVGFALAGLWRGLSSGTWKGAASTWLLLSAIFGAVSAWLHLQG